MTTNWRLMIIYSSGGSRGGAWGPPLFWVKKKEMTEGKKASKANKSRLPPPPPPPLAQGLDPSLYFNVISGAIIGDGDRKSWDARGPMIWDNFLFLEQIAPS